MSQRWRAVGNTVSDLTAQDLNRRPSAPETNVLQLDQLAGVQVLIIIEIWIQNMSIKMTHNQKRSK